MAKLINYLLLAIIIAAFVVPQESEAFIFKGLLKKALFAKKALIAPKLLLAKKALPLLLKKKPLLLKAKKLLPLAVGAKLVAAKKFVARPHHQTTSYVSHYVSQPATNYISSPSWTAPIATQTAIKA